MSGSAWAILVALSLIWSYNWIVMKQALAYAGPFTFSALRYAGGTAVLFCVLWARGARLTPPPFWPTLGIGLTQTAGFQALVQWALEYGGAGKTALLAYTMPFWAIALAWPLLHTRPDRRQWRAIGLAAAGLFLVVAPWQAIGSMASVLLALAGGFSWGAGTVLAKRLFLRHPDASLLGVSAWQMLYGTVALVLLACLIPQPPVSWTPPLIGALAYNVLLASGLGWSLWLLLVQRLPAHIASLTSLATPLLGVFLAWLILQERPGRWEFAGMALIVAALLELRRR